MTEDWFDTAERDSIHAVAADWFTRLQDPDISLDDTLAWQSWISADERHAHAFRRIEETWHRFQDMPRPALLRAEALAADRYDGEIPVSSWLSRKPAMRARPRTLRVALAASVVIAVLSAAAMLYASSSRIVFETAVGETRTVRLQDGSSVALGGHTRVAINFVNDARRLTLDRGEAFFTVAKDSQRPFSVRAGSATVTAIGTAFNVRRADDRVIVAVASGRVLVEQQQSVIQQLPLLRTALKHEEQPQRLDSGERTTVDKTGIESSTHMTDADAAAAWQTGRLAFEREPLHYVLEDVNRYASKPIVMSDDSLGNLRITGTVLSDNIAGWVSSLESAFALQAVDEPERIVLKRKP